ncbi:uncharacterized protein H6S33_003389 [Morchella sextelata]|uniref:uncharacterized protein n=1 Tax=Morchella sextelata TaxID=1174677 RepID=UPI001D045AE0|nr:uncharacterized protein H6S33_003389 [Morchella sextelata]KAH0606555.1 hypothetical protein H6S33_003389 [Morchella sextelata]
MVFHSSIARALVAYALFLSGANCQESIVKPDQLSLVTKGEDYSIMWRVIDPPETSYVSITLVNPSMNLGGGLDIITNAFRVKIDDRNEGPGFFVYSYPWFPSNLLEASDTYHIRVVDGNVTLESQSFYIGSIADIKKKDPVKSQGFRTGPRANRKEKDSVRNRGPVLSAEAVWGLVGGATVILVLVLIVLVVYIARRGGCTIAKKVRLEGVERAEIKAEGPEEMIYRLAELETRIKELEGSRGELLSCPGFCQLVPSSTGCRITPKAWHDIKGNKERSELPGSVIVGKEATADLLQREKPALSRKPSAYKNSRELFTVGA